MNLKQERDRIVVWRDGKPVILAQIERKKPNIMSNVKKWSKQVAGGATPARVKTQKNAIPKNYAPHLSLPPAAEAAKYTHFSNELVRIMEEAENDRDNTPILILARSKNSGADFGNGKRLYEFAAFNSQAIESDRVDEMTLKLQFDRVVAVINGKLVKLAEVECKKPSIKSETKYWKRYY